MRIVLHFKELVLGELTEVDDVYVYNSNVEGETAFKKYHTSDLYKLWDSVDNRSETLFGVFAELAAKIRDRIDIVLSAKISKNDSDFTVLKKFGFLAQNQDSYWVEVAV